MLQICQEVRAIILLLHLQISGLYLTSTRCYDSLNEKNWMCELCTFSQIRSHIALAMIDCFISNVSLFVPVCMYVCMSVSSA